MAEVWAADFFLFRGDFEEAKKFLLLAQQTCSENERDQASLAWIKARILLVTALLKGEGLYSIIKNIRGLQRAAKRGYEKAGYPIPENLLRELEVSNGILEETDEDE